MPSDSYCSCHASSDTLSKICGENRVLRELLSRWVKEFDRADAAGIMSDHKEAVANLVDCPGCALDVVCEDSRELLEKKP